MYVYGPIKTGRLGQALYINAVPSDTCTYNCVYCRMGETLNQTTTRRNYYPQEDILTDIINHADRLNPKTITFMGDGEPTLCRHLGWLIRQTKEKTSAQVAVRTNGSLLFRKDVRQDLDKADLVILKIDVPDYDHFIDLNRPASSIEFLLVRQGILEFVNEYSGRIWVDVMLVKGYNDDEVVLNGIAERLAMIEPDKIFVITPNYPPAENEIKPVDRTTIKLAEKIFGRITDVNELDEGRIDLRGFINARQALLEISRRSSLSREQAAEIEKVFAAPGITKQLITTGELIEVRYNDMDYLTRSGKSRIGHDDHFIESG